MISNINFNCTFSRRSKLHHWGGNSKILQNNTGPIKQLDFFISALVCINTVENVTDFYDIAAFDEAFTDNGLRFSDSDWLCNLICEYACLFQKLGFDFFLAFCVLIGRYLRRVDMLRS